MKKIIAVLLSVLCLFSMCLCPAYALSDALGGILGDELGMTEEEDSIDQVLSYGIHYEMETLSNVSIMYKPSPTITFKAPCTAAVTLDTPLSVDYQFVCWKEKGTGNYYYPGDTIEVTGKVTLVAIWEEKTDNYPRVIRVIITAFEVFSHMLNKVLGIYDAYEEVENQYGPSAVTTTVPSTTEAA